MKTTTLLALIATTLLTTSTALAERPQRPARGPGPGHGFDDGPRGERREEIRARVEQKIKTYLTVELSSRLALDQKRALQLGDAVQRHMDRMHQRREKMHTAADTLRELVEKKAPDAQVKTQLDTVVGLAGKDDDLHAFLGDAAKFLNVTEQAKLALAMPEIMHDVQRLVRETRRDFKMRGPGGERDDD